MAELGEVDLAGILPVGDPWGQAAGTWGLLSLDLLLDLSALKGKNSRVDSCRAPAAVVVVAFEQLVFRWGFLQNNQKHQLCCH